ncbi:MAG: septum site-determining protein MinD [Burkholderiales bacterium]|jgi:septum site-determining protein MinD
MSEVIVVTSGKGGVGKTTTSANLSAGLALRGKKVAVIDFDVGLRNLDLVMGCERRVVYDFVNVINGEATLNQALIRDKNAQNLYILPASQTRDKEALTEAGVEKVIKDLKAMGFDYIVCDSPAGIENGAIMALTFADHAIVVVNPEVSSVRDSDRIIGILQSRSRRAKEGREPVQERLLITRYSPKRVRAGEMLSYLDILEILKVPLLGVIPESQRVLESSNAGVPAVHEAGTEVAQAYADAIDRFLGKQVPLRFVADDDKGFLRRLFGSMGSRKAA